MRILIVEDEKKVSGFIKKGLEVLKGMHPTQHH